MHFPIASFSAIEFNLNDERLKKELLRNAFNFYVYILECADGSYYVGLTNNLEARFKEHVKGLNSKSYTYSRRPVILKYFELYHLIRDAIERENQLKRWSRKKKEALFKSDWEKLKSYSQSKSK